MAFGRFAFVVFAATLLHACTDATLPEQEQRILSFDFLMRATDPGPMVQLSEFVPPAGSAAAMHTFAGRLRLSTRAQRSQLIVLTDELDLVPADRAGVQSLPAFDFEFVQTNDVFLPVNRGPIANDSDWWEYILQPGSVWHETSDGGFDRAVIPFALKEKHADCIHNGLMSFLFNELGETSQVAFQISSQTCKYLQFELNGLINANYTPGEVTAGESVIASYQNEIAERLPHHPIEDLSLDFAGANPDEFGSIDEIAPNTMTLYGFVIDDSHYVGGCNTPYGMYPYCDYLALPSYSTAKSLVGGLALMRAEKLYPGTARLLIQDYVPECSDGWDGVTIENALDMTTGHYNSPSPHVDEDAAIVSRFFISSDHATKVDYACNEYPRKSEPGTTWVYQTWATYLAGTAINARLQSLTRADADFYTDLIVEQIWKPLHLSPLTHSTRRTDDDIAQPYTGFGLGLQRDDVAKLAIFLGPNNGRIDGEEVLDRSLFAAIKQRAPGDPGMTAETKRIRYNNGFRTFDVSDELGCKTPTWITTMSGYGGINIILMPNDTAYYYFSDGNVHRYLHAVRESHRIRPLCNAVEGTSLKRQ